MLLPVLVLESALVDEELVGTGDVPRLELLVELELEMKVGKELVVLGWVELDEEGTAACGTELDKLDIVVELSDVVWLTVDEELGVGWGVSTTELFVVVLSILVEDE